MTMTPLPVLVSRACAPCKLDPRKLTMPKVMRVIHIFISILRIKKMSAGQQPSCFLDVDHQKLDMPSGTKHEIFRCPLKKKQGGPENPKARRHTAPFFNKNARVFPHHCVGFWIFAGNPHPPPFSSSSSRRPPSSSLTSHSSLSTSLYHTHLYQPVSMINFSPSTCLYHFHLYQLLSDHTPLYQLVSIPLYLSGGRRGTWWSIWALGHRELGWRGCFAWQARWPSVGAGTPRLLCVAPLSTFRVAGIVWPLKHCAWALDAADALRGRRGTWWPTVDCLCKSCPV